MFKSLRIISALAGGALIAAPAAAATFASFNSAATANNIRWVRSGTSNGALYSTSSISGMALGTTAVRFRFTAPVLAALGDLNATLSVSASATSKPADKGGVLISQEINAGSFAFIYTGADPLDVFGTIYNPGANLVSGTFAKGYIAGVTGSNTASVLTASAGTMTLTSDFLDMTPAVNAAAGMSLTLAGLTAGLNAGAGQSLNTFRGNASIGMFESSLAPAVLAVPEPAVWATLVTGFALVGTGARRRRVAVAA